MEDRNNMPTDRENIKDWHSAVPDEITPGIFDETKSCINTEVQNKYHP